MSRITVQIQVGDFPSSLDRTFAMELDKLQQEALTPLDFPSLSLGMFCTPESVVRRVLHTRAITAREMAHSIVAAMRSSDTYDGYIPIDPITGIGAATQGGAA